MNEHLLKTSDANVLSSREKKNKKTQENLMGGGGGEGGGHPPLYVGGLLFLAGNFIGYGSIFSNVHHAGKKKEAKARDRRKLLHYA